LGGTIFLSPPLPSLAVLRIELRALHLLNKLELSLEPNSHLSLFAFWEADFHKIKSRETLKMDQKSKPPKFRKVTYLFCNGKPQY
jgi:hypothetical protein